MPAGRSDAPKLIDCDMIRQKLFFLGLIALGAVACKPKTVMPEWTEVAVDTTFSVGPMTLAVQYDFASIRNAAGAPALEAIERANIETFFGLEGFAGSAREAAMQSVERLKAEAQSVADAERTPFEGYVTTAAEAEVVDTLLVYRISFAEYRGGAHGMHGQHVRNYSLPGGYRLELGDLFDERQMQGLRQLVREKLYAQFGVSSDEGLAEQGFFPEYIDTTENFAVTPEGGIVFYYNPYDIGCYALGSVEVAVDGAEIAALTE